MYLDLKLELSWMIRVFQDERFEIFVSLNGDIRFSIPQEMRN